MTIASAPGKIILLGEHAVVYRRPALAVPLQGLSVRATTLDHDENGLLLQAVDLDVQVWLDETGSDNPLAKAVRLTLDALDRPSTPNVVLTIESNLPIAAGLGSGAAVSIAIIRSLSQHLGHRFSPERQAELAFEVEKLHHGTPSGIDNTVIAYESPVYFIIGAPLETFHVGHPFLLLIGDTGIQYPTAEAVAGLRQRWQSSRDEHEAWFDDIGQLVNRARQAMAVGNLELLGDLMNQNQAILSKLEVSNEALDRLIQAARQEGALGAKLSGGGLGGNMIALVELDRIHQVRSALHKAGAVRVLQAEVGT